MNKQISKIIIVIPSLSPDKELIKYIKDLITSGFSNIIVVNDGSDKEYNIIFDEIKNINGVILLEHPINKGKGAALKTAFNYIKNNCEDYVGVLTVDADGQHLPKDCINIAEKMLTEKKGLYLGCRDFDDPRVPWKSRFGNKLTRFLFKSIYKRILVDTQTGLRGFLKNDLELMINTEGNRYEYEMEMLIKASLNGLEFICIPIDTVYINQNEGSHFRPLKDGLKIYKILFRKHNK